MLNSVELFKIAMEIEKNGIEFYKKAKEFFNDPILKDLFQSFSDMETDHYNTFLRMSKKEKKCSYNDNEEIKNYLKKFMDPNLFNNNDALKISNTLKTELDIFNFALEKERESVEFYSFLKNGIEDLGTINSLNKIIDEEKQHIKIISEYVDKLKSK